MAPKKNAPLSLSLFLILFPASLCLCSLYLWFSRAFLSLWTLALLSLSPARALSLWCLSGPSPEYLSRLGPSLFPSPSVSCKLLATQCPSPYDALERVYSYTVCSSSTSHVYKHKASDLYAPCTHSACKGPGQANWGAPGKRRWV